MCPLCVCYQHLGKVLLFMQHNHKMIFMQFFVYVESVWSHECCLKWENAILCETICVCSVHSLMQYLLISQDQIDMPQGGHHLLCPRFPLPNDAYSQHNICILNIQFLKRREQHLLKLRAHEGIQQVRKVLVRYNKEYNDALCKDKNEICTNLLFLRHTYYLCDSLCTPMITLYI